MIEMFQMWALIEVLGLLLLPLTVTVFHNLPDRGWAFSKTLGLAVFSFGVWFPLMCLPTLPYSQPFILAIAILFSALCLVGLWRMRATLLKFVRLLICRPMICGSLAILSIITTMRILRLRLPQNCLDNHHLLLSTPGSACFLA